MHRFIVEWGFDRSRLKTPYLAYTPRHKSGNHTQKWPIDTIICTPEQGIVSLESPFLITIKMNRACLIQLRYLLKLIRRRMNCLAHVAQYKKNPQKFFLKQTGYMTERMRFMILTLKRKRPRSTLTLAPLTPIVQRGSTLWPETYWKNDSWLKVWRYISITLIFPSMFHGTSTYTFPETISFYSGTNTEYRLQNPSSFLRLLGNVQIYYLLLATSKARLALLNSV